MVVDVKNDELRGGALEVPHGDEVVGVVNGLMRRFELVIATQDWHPPDHTSFAVNHPGRRPGKEIQLDGVPQMLWPAHCVAGSAGAAFASGLETERFEAVFRKGTDVGVDSYSGFFDNRQLRETGLGEYLARRGVDEVWVAGLATDYCVRFTALDARGLGLRTVVVEDACRGVELQPGDVAAALAEMRGAGCRLSRSDETA